MTSLPAPEPCGSGEGPGSGDCPVVGVDAVLQHPLLFVCMSARPRLSRFGVFHAQHGELPSAASCLSSVVASAPPEDSQGTLGDFLQPEVFPWDTPHPCSSMLVWGGAVSWVQLWSDRHHAAFRVTWNRRKVCVCVCVKIHPSPTLTSSNTSNQTTVVCVCVAPGGFSFCCFLFVSLM